MITIVLIKEGDVWIAQCLEHDIAASGKTQTDAIAMFQYIYTAEIAYALEKYENPSLGHILSAPKYYWGLANEVY